MTEVIKFQGWQQGLGSVASSYVTHFDKSITIHRRNDTEVKINIAKVSYYRRLPELVDFMNYFMEKYDPLGKLSEALITVNSWIDNDRADIDDIEKFAESMYSQVFQPSIKEAVINLVNDNFEDFDKGKMRPTNYKPFFIAKDAMIVSTVIKLIFPAVFKYIERKNLNARDVLYTLYKPAFDVFKETHELHDGIKGYAESKAKSSYMRNKLVYDILKKDVEAVSKSIFEETLVSETLFKCTFNKNCVNLISVIVDKQLQYLVHSAVSAIIEPAKLNARNKAKDQE